MKFETHLWKNANILRMNYNVAATLLFIAEKEDTRYTQSENTCELMASFSSFWKNIT